MKTISRRKKLAIAVFFAVLLLLIALFILIGGRDQITEINEGLFSASDPSHLYHWIRHSFEKGEELELDVGISMDKIDENTIQLMIGIHQEGDTDYDVKNLRAELYSSPDANFFNAFATAGNGEYFDCTFFPHLSISENSRVYLFDGENYLCYTAIVTGDVSGMSLKLRYDIHGKNRYFLNKFYNNTATLPISFPESAEPDSKQESEETNPVTNEESDRMTGTVEEEYRGGKVHFGRIVRHSFEKGAELNLRVGVSRDKIDENTYRLTIIFDRDENEDYEVEDLNAILRSDRHGVAFINAFASGGDNKFSVPSESVSENVREQSFHGGNGYLYYTAILQGNSEMTLEVRYRIQGKNRYRRNVFYGNTVTVPIDRFPESAEPDPKQESEETHPATNEEEDEEVVAVDDTSIKRIDECFGDYFMLDNGVFCANISGESSWRDHTFTKGDYLGEILSSTEERDLKKIEPWAANVLPVGTKLYHTKERGGVIVAEVDGELIPYVEIREG